MSSALCVVLFLGILRMKSCDDKMSENSTTWAGGQLMTPRSLRLSSLCFRFTVLHSD